MSRRRFGKYLAKVLRRAQLTLEQLEDRILLNGDGPFANSHLLGLDLPAILGKHSSSSLDSGRSGPVVSPLSSPQGPLISTNGTTILAEQADPVLRSNPGSFGGDPMGADGFSSSGVRYADGTVRLAFADLEGDGFGYLWGHTRYWSNQSGIPNSINARACWSRNCPT
jgi:hypothetical protein